ncbi:hypothetical protein UN63_12435 [Oceanisphaera arctica]|uniref:Tyr recombinase domain-containing protein n=2 Tax=Oceanisphaera arctica TaxID=641510 RepID=A0A2P5TK61_9GAMM|nr:hypothetical protein UN63_12435 [Oceanisphaera arctica]
MLDILNLALLTALRRSELVNIRWCDVNWTEKSLKVRSRKHPQNHLRHTDTIYLNEDALKIISNQPLGNDNDFIFPYKADAISNEWKKAREQLNIIDLRFHDIRAEAACRFFEYGFSAVEVSKVTGHRNLDVLNNHYLRLRVVPTSNYPNL